MIQPMSWVQRRQAITWIVLSLMWFGALSSLLGQTNEEVFREYQFDFSLPGARANALGGAFIGLSDDATSSFSNPAGLAFLRDPAVTVEYRYRELEPLIGTLSGTVNFQFEQDEQRTANISFLSLNYRFGEWYLALYGYDFVDATQERDFVARSLVDGVQEISVIDVQLGLKGEVFGAGVARRYGPFKFGLTLNYAGLEAHTRYTKEQIVITPDVVENFFASRIDSTDYKLSWTIGALYEFNEAWSFGAVFRKDPRFNLTEHVEEFTAGQPPRIADFTVPFVVPDVAGFGVRVRPRHTFNILVDWQHVFYSQIIDSGFTIIENPEFDSKSNYTIGDTDEFHLGVEWLLPLDRHVWAFRAGYYNNPNHQVRYIGDDPVKQSLFSRTIQDDEDHLTLGIGLVRGNRLQIDLSMNVWQQGREFTTSFIWRKK